MDEVMSGDVRWCFEDQSLDEVMAQMGDSQIRRVPVVSHDEQHRLIGIVSLGDLATRLDGAEARVEQVVEQVSSPSADGMQARGGAGARAGASAGAGAATGMKNGVPEALTGIDERSQGGRLEEVGVSGQPRIDNSGEPMRNAGSYDPADNASLERDVDGRKPPSTPYNAV